MHGLDGQRTEPNSFLPSWRCVARL